jgi:hypothetical protein
MVGIVCYLIGLENTEGVGRLPDGGGWKVGTVQQKTEVNKLIAGSTYFSLASASITEWKNKVRKESDFLTEDQNNINWY